MVIAVVYVMARRRKGAAGNKAGAAKTKTARRTKANGLLEDRPNGSLKKKADAVEDESHAKPPDEPLSCRTPMEMCPTDPTHGEPPPVILPTPQHIPVVHKKFGKFRCLLEAESPEFQRNCSAMVEEEKVIEVVVEPQEEEIVIEQVEEGTDGEILIEQEVEESEEVVWEEEVVEETVVCDSMEMELEDVRSQETGRIAEDADSQESDYSGMIEVRDSDYASQDEQMVIVREGEFENQEIIEETDIPHITEAISHTMVLKNIERVEDEEELRRNSGLHMVEREIVTAKNTPFENDGGSNLKILDEYSQESEVSVRGVEMEIETEQVEEQDKCSTYRDVTDDGISSEMPPFVSSTFEGKGRHGLVRCSEENFRVLGEMLFNDSEKDVQTKLHSEVETLDYYSDNKSSDTKDIFKDIKSVFSAPLEQSNQDLSDVVLASDIDLNSHHDRLSVNSPSKLQNMADFVERIVTKELEATEEVAIDEERTVEEDSDLNESAKVVDDDGDTKPPSSTFRSRSGSTDTTGSESGSSCSVGVVRRSNRIRSIGIMKQRSREKSEPAVDTSDGSEAKVMVDSGISECCSSADASSDLSSKVPVPLSSPANNTMVSPVIPAVPMYEMSVVDMSKPVKVKSRWRRSSELEMGGKCSSDSELAVTPPAPSVSPRPVQQIATDLSPQSTCSVGAPAVTPPLQTTTFPPLSPPGGLMEDFSEDVPLSDALLLREASLNEKKAAEEAEKLRNFVFLPENQYLTDRSTSKEAKRMVCDCFLTKEEWNRGDMGCGEDCLNRLLMIECGSRCSMGDRCSNKGFQKQEYSKCEIFKTEKKGFGLKALCDLPTGAFIMEYIGEVLDPKEFRRRAKDYSKEKNRHYYFMALKSDAIIDATMKGNNSRFINHSCDPNSETQKWTVNGELRIGFFSKRPILSGEEVTFDYQLQRYGKEAQRCHCESSNCRGWIGEDPEKEKRERKERKEREVKKKKEEKRKDVKEFLDDMDLEEEIEKLSASGLKNRAHTLTLCRLMVRAEDRESRVQLLKLIQGGETACRRLFLDYHGLRLVWSWMMDVGSDNSEEELELKTEILQTLAKLPIPNKTMLQDSKVMSMVEKWLAVISSECGDGSTLDLSQDSSKKESLVMELDQDPIKKESFTMELSQESAKKESLSSEVSQDSVIKDSPAMELSQDSLKKESPTIELSQISIKKESQQLDEESGGSDVDIKPRIDAVLPGGMEIPDDETVQGLENEKQVVDGTPEVTASDLGLRRTSDSDDEGGDETSNNPDKRQVFIKLATRLLKEWNSLKEVFRIPKKERIEQMKEHEREADRGYKEYLDKGGHHDKQSYDRHWRQDRFRSDLDKRDRKRTRESPESDRSRKGPRFDERNMVPGPRMSKHERRHLFALKVAQEEEEERHRRQQQEMWRHHEGQCLALGMDPNLTAAIDPQTGYPCFFDPTSGTWQSYPPQDPNSMPPQDMRPSPVFNPHSPHLSGMPGLPSHGMPPHSQGGHHGPPLPHGPSPHGPPLPQGPLIPHGHNPQIPPMPHGPGPQGPPIPHGPGPQGPPIPHGPGPQGPPIPHGPSPHGPPLPHGAPPLLPHGPPAHPHRASPHFPHGPPHPNRSSPHAPLISHKPSLLGPGPAHLLQPHGPPLPRDHPHQGTPPLLHGPHVPPMSHVMPLQGPPHPHGMPPQGQGPPHPHGMPPQGQGPTHPHGMPPHGQGPPHPHGMSPQGPPHPHGMPPQGQGPPHPHGMPPHGQGPPHPHGMPPQGPPLPNGVPPHSHDVSPYGMPPHSIPPHAVSPHHAIPPHGAPPLPNHAIPSHAVHAPLPPGPQPVFQPQPPAQQVYTPQPGSGDPPVPQPQYHQQVHPIQQHPYIQPVPLPPKWKSAKDSEGRVYYYHVKTRVSQWEPPQWNQVSQQPESETSSESSEDEEDEDEEESSTTEEDEEVEQEEKVEEDEEEEEEEAVEDKDDLEEEDMVIVNPDESSSAELIEETDITMEAVGPSRSLLEEDLKKREKKRDGLVQERIISPRREEDHSENNNKRYKEIKEKLRRKKELKRALERSEKGKKRHRDDKSRSGSKSEKPVTVAADTSSDAASRRIKDQFRLQMAGVIVQFLNPYRKPDCKIGRIKTTEDFKHVARKLTHFVMLKELKHCRNVNDLECNENVKHKAKDFIRKYMAKYGPVYVRPKDELT